jgi:asparagine synthase (glutamine-hydrolysing)
MSIIFGLLRGRDAFVSEVEMHHLACATERYGTGAGTVYVNGRLGMGFQPYFSHQRSEMETRPITDARGNVLSFDGRLDNYKELAKLVGLERSEASDSEIVLAAFDCWGDECFSHLIGDWALALWSESDQSLYLARDHAGTRTLYLEHQQTRMLWSTQLDTFRCCRSELRLAEDYVVHYLASRPIRNLTPYKGILSVPPAQYLILRNGVISRNVHWSPVATGSTRYKTDVEYEDHFLGLFKQSIERRTGPGEPILAQLSGGMDSTSIVCMSDCLRRSADPAAEILDTVSFFDDSESSLNERKYFSITEAQRGKVGTHLDIAFSQRTFEAHDGYLLPGADSFSIEQERRFYDAVWQRGYRSILSGIGGDEVLGGIPTPLPELAGYLVSGNVARLLCQSFAWSLIDRSPLLGTLYETAKYTIDIYAHSAPPANTMPPWISDPLRKRYGQIETGSSAHPSRTGITPYRLDNGRAWWSVMETLPHLFPQLLSRPEYRYPFLDKDLVNYLFSIPRDQVLRPGRRRSLMRRALVNIVPHEILEQRRKAFQLRSALRGLRNAQPVLERLFAHSLAASAGFINIDKLRTTLTRTVQGDSKWWQQLLRTIALELWLKASNRERLSVKTEIQCL